LQPDKKNSAPTIVPPNRSATLDKASLLFMTLILKIEKIFGF
jgi:hypothetical protein